MSATSRQQAEAQIKAFNARYATAPDTDCRLVVELRQRGFNAFEISGFLEALDEVCLACFDHPRPCTCTKDE